MLNILSGLCPWDAEHLPETNFGEKGCCGCCVVISANRASHRPRWWTKLICGILILIGLVTLTWDFVFKYAPLYREDIGNYWELKLLTTVAMTHLIDREPITTD